MPRGAPRRAAQTPQTIQRENKVKLTDTIRADARSVKQSIRTENVTFMSSCDAGEVMPLAYIPLLREDRVSRGSVDFMFEMQETAETLMNAVNVTVFAYFVPFLAFERFNGLDSFNRAWNGEPEKDGTPIPLFDTVGYSSNHAIWNKLGVHAVENAQVNSAPVEAYNAIVNHRRQARSTKLPLRAATKRDTLAAAFWKNTAMSHVVPDFDQAMIDGELDLNFAATQLPVKGIGTVNTTNSGTNYTVNETDETAATTFDHYRGYSGIAVETLASGFPSIYAELENQGITLSLSNIEMAKKTAAFAALRKEYSGLDDDSIIDMLMSGIRVPDAQMSQPILLDRQSTIFGYNKRYATDSGNLTKSVTNGQAALSLNIRTPPMNTGGIIMCIAEIVPEQLYERQKDHFIYATSKDDLPDALKDELDPEKVSVVTNDHVDVLHSSPTGTFGYAPLNHEWQRNIPRIGGKFMRPDPYAFDEDRQRLWSVETVDPTLNEDFYLATNIHHNVFADSTSDAFEVIGRGSLQIVGNTVFGKGLVENTDDYQTIAAQVDDTRIDQTV